ncbi:hypothetical protein METBIDRAFT_107438 [Metschnikowia bicuspidata var. bicuspidata NRRL YB-4993]|uniref:t-SNARE coiled-coil homology domain-containing protein n=1 Tax=Metschnikowia bicuspidata var. bicuspidata NRRL YB-4993 TaxID=869754 RepID=A0A1A0HI35_9ASCO|nr:hypothetical protein METBIDRAFT_107438 [Metschnikowia bicuspidata var. bicuspidata NRRL YB-4993]OBA23542.1 hypothetical protein METBIDRAFT_107438 [Metschnikowia bicuspidata var. bicuspidata NRRL YB-4993]
MDSRYSTAGSGHLRDLRTQLFSTPQHRSGGNSVPLRMSSPYESAPLVSARHNEAFLLSLEDQNNSEVDQMSSKVSALKSLGVMMGLEISKSMHLNDEISGNFERGSVTLKNTYNRMVLMSKRAGISWKMWLVFFAVFFLMCYYVWLF